MSATAVVLPPGETLAGFRICEVIGVGGMAVVYRAEQMSLHREVALKVLSHELGRDEVFSERFRREGMHVALLDHPHVIPIYDAGEDKGRLFLAMRLVVGMTLAERMRVAPLSARETLDILRPIADGLDAAHAIGLVHRDIKPQNILITERGHPYLADFGIAKGVETAGLTVSGGFVGSFHYAAPEQVLGAPAVPATDVYALTAVLYQCLTGTVPYSSDTDVAVLYAQVNKPPPELPPGEADELNAVITRGMAKDPGDRYASAGELIAAAEHSLQDLPARRQDQRPALSSTAAPATPKTAQGTKARSTQPPPAGANPSARTPRRARRVVWVTAVLAILAAAIGWGLLGTETSASWTVAHSRDLAISYRTPWRSTHLAFGAFAVTPATRALGSAPIQLASGSATLAGGSLTHSAATPGGIPPVLRTRFGRATRGTARLSSGPAVAVYNWTLRGGRTVRAWVIPTVRGDVAVICSAPSGMSSAMRSCSAMATRADVDGISLLAAGPDLTFARSLERILAPVSAKRATLGGMFRAGSSPSGTRARTIARADSDAVKALGKLTVPARYRSLVSALALTLRGEAHTLGALARAADRQDAAEYANASAEVAKASRKVQAQSARARRAGLLSGGLAVLRVPSLPARTNSSSGPSVGNITTQSSTTTTTTTPTPPPPSTGSGSTSTSSSNSSKTSSGNGSSGPLF